MPTITGIATSDPQFSILVSALSFLDSTLSTDLVATLDDPTEDLTVFAPTNAAFAALAADLGYGGDPLDTAAVTGFLVANVEPATLLDVVTYHVSPGTQLAVDIAAGGVVATLNGATIQPDLPTLVDNEPDLIDPSLTATDIGADNGVVHIIDRVLLPLDLPGNDAETITGIVTASGVGFDNNPADFDLLREAVTTAGLAGVLDDASLDLTVFAPSDAAFVGLAQALGYGDSDEAGAWGYLVEALTLLGAGDPIPLLTDVLNYHVVGESLQASQVLGSSNIATLQGGEIGISGTTLIDQDPDVADPGIVATDIQAANGVVHVIDGVLLPADLLASDGAGDVDFIIAGNDAEFTATGADADFVDANGGNDSVDAGAGADVVLAGAGNDAVLGGEGNDTIKGDAGNDSLVGADGDDVIVGGAGLDLMVGGKGSDTFVFAPGDGIDLIFDFQTGQDVLDLSAYELGGLEGLEHRVDVTRFGTVFDFGNGDGFVLVGEHGVAVAADDLLL